MNTHEKTGNAGTFPVIFLIIKISARNTSVNKQSNYKDTTKKWNTEE